MSFSNNLTTTANSSLPGELPDVQSIWFFFVITLVITIIFQMLCFTIAAVCKFDLITDLAGSMNFVVLALFSLIYGGQYYPRQIVSTAIICATRFELGIFLLVRVCVRKKDARFDELRENCVRFLMFWIFQIFWVWVVSVAIIFVNSALIKDPMSRARLGAVDYVGWAIALLGWVIQMIADIHKYLFRKNPANKYVIMNKGLWYISRHPNYLGEILVWWGLWIASVPSFKFDPAGYATIISPVFTMLILFSVSGIMSSEGKNLARYYKNDKTREEFDKYFNGTPPVFPLLPSCYKCCHPTAKAIFCCDFPCYRYKEEETEDDKKTENQKEGKSVEIDDVEKNASASVMHGSPTKDEMSSTLLENVESSES